MLDSESIRKELEDRGWRVYEVPIRDQHPFCPTLMGWMITVSKDGQIYQFDDPWKAAVYQKAKEFIMGVG